MRIKGPYIGIGRRSGSSAVVPLAPELLLTFDSIANASGMIGGNATSLAAWNTAFGLPASPFTSIQVIGNVVNLCGGSNITVPDNLFSTNWDESGHLISIVDTLGCIVAAGINSFGDYLALNDNDVLITVTLPALITAGDYCFSNCVTLATPDFSTLVTAGDYCFADCTLLSVPVFTVLFQAGYGCFSRDGGTGCINLNTDFIALETAGDMCFKGCTGLTNPDFSTLTSAGEGCFKGCTGLTNPDFSTLTSAGEGCFEDCTNLNTDFSTLTSAGEGCFGSDGGTGCTALTTPDFSALVTAGKNCFLGCTNLSVPIFTLLEEVGDGCFSGCTSFLTMNFPALLELGTTSGDDSVFTGITGKVITMTIPAALMICDDEDPDGDIAYLVANNISVTITQV